MSTELSNGLMQSFSRTKSVRRFCKYCGSPIDTDTCTGCGKRYHVARKIIARISIVVLAITAILAIFLSGYIGFNYHMAVKAANKTDFEIAKQYYDNLYIADKIFPSDYAYVEAGILMDQGRYIGALEAFEELEDHPVPNSTLNYLKEKIYSQGLSTYRKGSYQAALQFFQAVPDYLDADDYCFLIQCQTNHIAEKDYVRLFSLVGFEDTDKIILNEASIAMAFLSGRWEDHGQYLSVDTTTATINHNFPLLGERDYFRLQGGVCYSVTKTEGSISYQEYKQSKTAHFEIKLISTNEISIICYADGNSYTLYRQ